MSGAPGPLEGYMYPCGSSRRSEARLQARPGLEVGTWALDLIAADGSVVAQASLSDLTLDPRLGRQPRRMAFPDGTLFETEDHAGIDALTGYDRWSWLHAFERFHPRLIGITVCAVVAMVFVYRYVLNWLVAAAVALTPPAVVTQIDRGTLRTMDFTLTDETELSQAERDRVQAIFADVVAALPPRTQDQHDFTLLFRDAPGMGPNAFALPGGTVVFTDQFLEMFPQDDVIAAVIGHELGHVVDEHGLQQLYRALGLYFLVTMLAGETGPLMEDVLLEGNALLSLSYSRAHEREADAFGLRLSHAAGYDPRALRVFFEKIQEMTGDVPEFLSTHPSNAGRLEAIDALADELAR